MTGSGQLGVAQQCLGDLWSSWAGQQPSRSSFGFDGYQWRLDGSAIAGATAQSYVPTSADVGHQLSCTVTATYPLLVVTVAATSPAVTVFSAMSLTQGVLGQAETLLAGAGKHDANKLQEIVDKLSDSLDSSLWVDGNHLDPKHGQKVFDREREAVGKLLGLLDSKSSAIPDAALQGMIDSLVQADGILAEDALADAVAASGDADKIAHAQRELAKAADEAAMGRFDHAIEQYRKAWKNAERAMH